MPNKPNKTTETTKSVKAFIAAVPDAQKQADSFKLIEIMQKLSGHEPKMWGPSIIGFGTYHYKYESGREGDAPLIGFSPRKPAFTLYLTCDAKDPGKFFQSDLGKFKTSTGGCIYFKRLSDINIDVLEKMIVESLKYTKKKYKT